MEKAKELLSNQKQLPLAEVAAWCGNQDYHDFITVFRLEVGALPEEMASFSRIRGAGVTADRA